MLAHLQLLGESIKVSPVLRHCDAAGRVQTPPARGLGVLDWRHLQGAAAAAEEPVGLLKSSAWPGDTITVRAWAKSTASRHYLHKLQLYITCEGSLGHAVEDWLQESVVELWLS